MRALCAPGPLNSAAYVTALESVVDESIGARDISRPMSTEQFVRAAIALAQGSMTQRLVEPGSLELGELERILVPVLLGYF